MPSKSKINTYLWYPNTETNTNEELLKRCKGSPALRQSMETTQNPRATVSR